MKKNITVLLLVLAMIILAGSFYSVRSAHAAEQKPVYKYYTSVLIEEGDTLSEIASRYMTPGCGNMSDYLFEVRNINHIVGDNIHTGCYIVVPYYSTEEKI